MKNIFPSYTAALLTVFSLLLLFSCSSEIEPTNEVSGNNEGIMMPLTLTGIPYNYEETTSSNQSEVAFFHFKNDDFILSNIVKNPYSEDLQISVGSTSKIYCASGVTLKATPGNTKEHDFAHTVVSFDKKSNNAPLFYSSIVDVNTTWRNGKVEVALERSVSKIDFSNFVDASVHVTEVTVVDAPASTYVFDIKEMPSEETLTLTKKFDTPFQGSESDLFQIFSSTRPVHVRVLGEYNGASMEIEAELPYVERNKIYTLNIAKASGRFVGSFKVKEWEASNANAKAFMAEGIDIDKANSYLPSGVMIDYNMNQVSVPATGISGLRLAFAGPSKVTVTSVDGNAESVKISSSESVRSGENCISSFDVEIAPQRNGSSGYSVMVNLRDESGRYDFVEIVVPSYHYIETVKIAGSEWMSFNAVSDDPDNQVFPIEGVSVEEMYRDHWVQSIGNFFQFGKKKGYNPWTRNDPNGNSATERETSWTSAKSMPVPEGYHVASSAEWLNLLPAGTTIPSTYKAGNGEIIKADVVELSGTVNGTPSITANEANLKMRYIRFESLETGNVLILPVCGQKAATWDEYPGSMWTMHTAVCYWTSDGRNECIQISDNNGQLKANQKLGSFDFDGFLPLRGIKN